MGKKKKDKISLVVTILNEAQNIELLLSSIMMQSRKPDEVVIVDGGSADNTIEVIKEYLQLGNLNKVKEIKHGFEVNNLGIDFKILKKKGNRSVGRNYAINHASHDLIAITDAGCILDSQWVSELEKKIDNADVVAGYYNSDPIGPFEEAVVPYVLVMPDRVNADNFLPATRSMMVRRDVFDELGGFDKKLSDNEDYALAKKMESSKVKIVFAKKAIVTWIPRSSLKSFFVMIMRFARGDIKAGIVRPKVVSVFLRYLVFILLFIYNFIVGTLPFILYLSWAVLKNKKYVKKGWYYLPILQVVSDFAVMVGSLQGLLRR
ncbi:MAG: glycosyltransferase [Candidatus Pacebacteria bacterium]|nr:glycosyltransferase [Candidatus Paceibacterota bacterium]